MRKYEIHFEANQSGEPEIHIDTILRDITEICKYLDIKGFSLVRQYGMYDGLINNSYRLMLIHDSEYVIHHLCTRIRDTYNQESVLCITSSDSSINFI